MEIYISEDLSDLVLKEISCITLSHYERVSIKEHMYKTNNFFSGWYYRKQVYNCLSNERVYLAFKHCIFKVLKEEKYIDTELQYDCINLLEKIEDQKSILKAIKKTKGFTVKKVSDTLSKIVLKEIKYMFKRNINEIKLKKLERELTKLKEAI